MFSAIKVVKILTGLQYTLNKINYYIDDVRWGTEAIR